MPIEKGSDNGLNAYQGKYSTYEVHAELDIDVLLHNKF